MDEQQELPQNQTVSTNPQSPKPNSSIITEVPKESQAISQKSMVLFPTVILLIIVSVLAGYLLHQNRELKKALKINSFADCVNEQGGLNPVHQSYPRVCVTKDGRRFIEEIKTPITTPVITEEPENTPFFEEEPAGPTLTKSPVPRQE